MAICVLIMLLTNADGELGCRIYAIEHGVEMRVEHDKFGLSVRCAELLGGEWERLNGSDYR